MLKALIFDFDGLILDTETPELDNWQKIYRDHGVELSTQTWGQIVGGYGSNHFNPEDNLQRLVDHPLDLSSLREQVQSMSLNRINSQKILPGVLDMITSARDRSLGLAIASSSPHSWVDGHLTRLGLYDLFDFILCGDDVSLTKPNPELFLSALDVLKVSASEAVVFEDSPNGVKASRSAGIFCIAIPNQVTIQLDLSHANLLLDSLENISLEDLITRFKK